MLRFICGAAVCCALVGCAVEPTTAPKEKTTKGAIPFVLDHVSDHFDGVVADVVFVDGYVYAAVDVAPSAETERRWIVSLKKPIAVGDRVSVNAFGKKDGFHSKKLDREFASLWFVVVTVTEQQQEQQGEKS